MAHLDGWLAAGRLLVDDGRTPEVLIKMHGWLGACINLCITPYCCARRFSTSHIQFQRSVPQQLSPVLSAVKMICNYYSARVHGQWNSMNENLEGTSAGEMAGWQDYGHRSFQYLTSSDRNLGGHYTLPSCKTSSVRVVTCMHGAMFIWSHSRAS